MLALPGAGPVVRAAVEQVAVAEAAVVAAVAAEEPEPWVAAAVSAAECSVERIRESLIT